MNDGTNLYCPGQASPYLDMETVSSSCVNWHSLDVLKVNISPVDISVAQRLSNKDLKNQRESCRKIIVKFCRRNVKPDILNECRKSKPSNLFVNEFLTPASQTSFVKQNKRVSTPYLRNE